MITDSQLWKLQREKLKEKSSGFMLKEKIKKRKCSANIRKDPVKHKKYKGHEKLRKWAAKNTKQGNAQMGTLQQNGEDTSTTNNSTRNSSPSVSCKQTLYCSIARNDLHLPKSLNKKAEVIQRLTTKYKLRENLKENRRRAK